MCVGALYDTRSRSGSCSFHIVLHQYPGLFVCGDMTTGNLLYMYISRTHYHRTERSVCTMYYVQCNTCTCTCIMLVCEQKTTIWLPCLLRLHNANTILLYTKEMFT